MSDDIQGSFLGKLSQTKGVEPPEGNIADVDSYKYLKGVRQVLKGPLIGTNKI